MVAAALELTVPRAKRREVTEITVGTDTREILANVRRDTEPCALHDCVILVHSLHVGPH